MTFVDAMHDYFAGERAESLAFVVPAALMLFVLAGVALRGQERAFGVGLAIPLVLFGLAALGTGLTVGLRTPAQVAALDAALATSPAAMVATELPRMRKVNANWPIYLGAYVVLVAVGLALRFGLATDWAHGAGPALVLIGAVGLLIDGFAERRARPYTAALEMLAKEHGVVELVF